MSPVAFRRAALLTGLIAGVIVGAIAFVAVPLPIGSNRHSAEPPASASTPTATALPTMDPSPTGIASPALSASASPTAMPTAMPTARATATPGEEPPFTRLALLQPEEFRSFGWGKADRTAITDGVEPDAPTRCAAPGTIAGKAEESYAAEYEGLQTRAVEIVVRLDSATAATERFDRLDRLVADCADAPGSRRARPDSRHRPRLPDVEQTLWWELDVPASSGGDRPARGALAVARVDDRLVYLLLTSPTSDPVSTVQFEPLVTQAARRLV